MDAWISGRFAAAIRTDARVDFHVTPMTATRILTARLRVPAATSSVTPVRFGPVGLHSQQLAASLVDAIPSKRSRRCGRSTRQPACSEGLAAVAYDTLGCHDDG